MSEGRTFTERELAELLSVRPALLAAFVARDLLVPCRRDGRMRIYDFRALAAARALTRLVAAGFTPARLERALAGARALVPDPALALQGLEASIGRKRLTLRLPDGRLVELDGQQVFDFEAAAAAAAGPVRGMRPPQAWFQIGVEAEAAGRLDEAVRAYEQALPAGQSEAHFNLGNCLYALGRKVEAHAQFTAAVGRDPGYAEAWNNLGIVAGELGQGEVAIAAFRRAIAIVPYYADAHFNLADALAAAGDVPAARAHWRAYLSYDPNSKSAEQVRRRLAQGSDNDA